MFGVEKAGISMLKKDAIRGSLKVQGSVIRSIDDTPICRNVRLSRASFSKNDFIIIKNLGKAKYGA